VRVSLPLTRDRLPADVARRGETAEMTRQSWRPFGDALLDLLRDEDVYLTGTGNVNLRAFARDLDGVTYQTLRRAITGERRVTLELLEECARVLRVRPDYFAEYRIEQVRRLFDPAEVGIDAALRHLSDWDTRHAV
jgi:transcriptional regulator with XRE-family HTH domain